MSEPERFSDPNPVFQSVIESCREKYAVLRPGAHALVSCSASLLGRMDPRGSSLEAPETRLKSWAAALGFEVGGQETITVTIRKIRK